MSMTREEQRQAMAERKGAARDALRTRVAGITPNEARHLVAEEIREASFSDPMVQRRVFEVLERLGIPLPAGFK